MLSKTERYNHPSKKLSRCVFSWAPEYATGTIFLEFERVFPQIYPAVLYNRALIIELVEVGCKIPVRCNRETNVSTTESHVKRATNVKFITSKSRYVITDVSMHGYGAILLQRGSKDQLLYPVYYASGKTTPAEEKYSNYELEVLAIVKAFKQFRVYLLGIVFKIVKNCQTVSLTTSKKDFYVRVARWTLLLEEFQYNIDSVKTCHTLTLLAEIHCRRAYWWPNVRRDCWCD